MYSTASEPDLVQPLNFGFIFRIYSSAQWVKTSDTINMGGRSWTQAQHSKSFLVVGYGSMSIFATKRIDRMFVRHKTTLSFSLGACFDKTIDQVSGAINILIQLFSLERYITLIDVCKPYYISSMKRCEHTQII